MFLGEEIRDLDFYESYVLGKSHKVKFNKEGHNSKGIIDYIHSDLWRLARMKIKGGSRSFFLNHR